MAEFRSRLCLAKSTLNLFLFLPLSSGNMSLDLANLREFNANFLHNFVLLWLKFSNFKNSKAFL